MALRTRWFTRANGLTLLRLLAAPAFAAALSAGLPRLAAALFALAVATDLADGWVARRFGETSPRGELVDHAVDAVFVTTGAAALAAAGVLPAALPVLIACAFLQYAFDSRLTAARGLRRSALGRWNGISYYAIVGTPVVRDALGLAWPGTGLLMALGWVLVASTAVSMGDRLRRLFLARRARGSPA
jgi:phosphatidylglycerophosphate synthase